MSRIILVVDTDDSRPGSPKWVAQIVANHLGCKGYVEAITMTVDDDDDALDPRQIWWGMDDDEFAATLARFAASKQRVEERNRCIAELHARRRELEAAGMTYAEAMAAAKREVEVPA